MVSLQSCALASNLSYQIPYNPLLAQVDRVLLESSQASEILRTLYQIFKERQSKVSLTFICRSAGIPSKGYLALVMNGQRRLHSKYWDSIFRTFKLNEIQKEILRTQLESEQVSCEHSRELLHRQILELRKALRNQDF